jgi:hypothetical protein
MSIQIKGKNVDELDLEKLENLIQQANQRSFKVNLKGLFKGLIGSEEKRKVTNSDNVSLSDSKKSESSET